MMHNFFFYIQKDKCILEYTNDLKDNKNYSAIYLLKVIYSPHPEEQ